jgi:hypothetical protein
MHECHAGFFVDPNAVIVRSAVLQTGVHGRRHVGQLACKTARGAGKKASNAAHQQRSVEKVELSVAASFDLHNFILKVDALDSASIRRVALIRFCARPKARFEC